MAFEEARIGSAFYNENHPFTIAWLRSLIDAGYVEAGKIDGRSITMLSPEDVSGFERVHFFAGIGGWDYALRLAGWRGPVWTGSCPCQPFSDAGKRRGTADERHLWPEFLRLIAKCRPSVIFGEQVASAAGRDWLAGIRTDLEALGYAIGAANLCAASIGAPHIRQRLFWVAYTGCIGLQHRLRYRKSSPASRGKGDSFKPDLGRGCATGRLGDSPFNQKLPIGPFSRKAHFSQPGGMPWDQAEWLSCLDGKARRIEPGTFPLADGIPARMGRVRGYGNAIVPQLAAEFVSAFIEAAQAQARAA